MGEEEKYLVDVLKKAIHSVYAEERFLLKYQDDNRQGMEQSFVFRVGIHLHEILKGTVYEALDLDSEYRKSQANLKVTINNQNGIRPDLIIHKRDTQEFNKMAVEFKGWWDTNIQDDLNKLIELTSHLDKYKYLIGVFVCIGKNSPDFKLFQNGIEI